MRRKNSIFTKLIIFVFMMMIFGAVALNASADKVIIAFSKQPGAAEEALVREAGGVIRFTYRIVPAIAADVPGPAIAELRKNRQVVRIEPDVKIFAHDAELDNTWGVKRIGAGVVHDGGNKGAGVNVAVIDSGTDYTHSDLDGNYAGGWDFVNNDNDPMDDNGHGTHTAGTVAAEDNNSGVVGVAPLANLYALKVLGSSGSGSFSSVIAALDWSVANGIQVTSNSYGSSQDPGLTVQAAFDNSAAAGIIHVASAGNSGNRKGKGDNVGYPARYDSVIAVAATDSNDERARFSSTGSAVEQSAPGVSIRSTLWKGGYGTKSGTSMAAPHVAGVAALIIAAGSGDVRTQLRDTAEDLGATGWDPLYGYGLVNVAVAAPVAVENQAPIADAGSDQNVKIGSLVQLDGAGSFDPDGDSISYSWAFSFKPGGSSASLSGANTATPAFVADVAGDYVVVLTVSDASLNDTDPVTITANPNSAPIADAGSDQNVNTGFPVQLDGTGSFDLDGDPITYSWTLIFQPVGSFASLSGASTATPTFTPDVEGVYEVELTVEDSDLSSDTDSVTITATPAIGPTGVRVDSIAYDTSGGRNNNKHLFITVALLDDLNAPVADAFVSIQLFRDGSPDASKSGTTGTGGTLTFTRNNAPSGFYETLIVDVIAAGLDWDGITPANGFVK